MLPTCHVKVGKPRLDPTQRRLHRFYEPRVLLSIIDPTRGREEAQSLLMQGSQQFQSFWRHFLDGSSWLCDNKHGGQTVSSIAAESLPSGTAFCLATKNEITLAHLQWVVKVLDDLRETSSTGKKQCRATNCGKVYLLSKNKVRTYGRFLASNLAKALLIEPKGANRQGTSDLLGGSDHQLTLNPQRTLQRRQVFFCNSVTSNTSSV